MRKLILSLAAAAGVFAAVNGAEAAPLSHVTSHAIPVATGTPLVQPVQYYGGPYGYGRPYGFHRHYGYYRGDGYGRWRRHVAWQRWHHYHGW